MARQSVALALLVHNEAHLLPRLFEQIGDRIDSAAIIVHPDYEDDSLEVAKELCEKYNLKSVIEQRDPPDPPTGENLRNEVFDLAREFGEDYVLWLDPDDPLIGTIPDELTAPIYGVEVVAKGTSWVVEHLVSKDFPDVRWEGVIHEALRRHDVAFEALQDCYIDRSVGSGGGPERMKNVDLPLLLKACEANPGDGHSWYYLAQTYRDLAASAEDPDEKESRRASSIAAFKHRAAMGGLQQMVYWCLFQVAEMTGSPEDYLFAFNVDPTRAEAPHRLAALYNARQQYNTARMFCLVGLNVPPTGDAMFVERWVEEYGLIAEMAVAEFYIGNQEKAEKAWEYVLTVDSVWPEHRVLFEHNLDEIKKMKRKAAKPQHRGRVTTKKKAAA